MQKKKKKKNITSAGSEGTKIALSKWAVEGCSKVKKYRRTSEVIVGE